MEVAEGFANSCIFGFCLVPSKVQNNLFSQIYLFCFELRFNAVTVFQLTALQSNKKRTSQSFGREVCVDYFTYQYAC